MKQNRRYLGCEGCRVFRGDRRDNGDDSDNAEAEKDVSECFVKCAHLIAPLLLHRVDKHPQRKQRKKAVDGVTGHGIFAPGFFFPAEHARHYHDYSDQLKNERQRCADPPSHVVTSLWVFFSTKIIEPERFSLNGLNTGFFLYFWLVKK
ncbi:hypothetical protein [Dehalogenimonas formicexedens]|nr:hypothetical protein [Dehalogenimonas formicexedens]